LKNLRTALYGALSGQPVDIPYIAQTKGGFPKALGPLIPFLKSGNINFIRSTLTLLLVSRMIPAWKKVDLSSITAGPNFSHERLKAFKKEIKVNCEELKIHPGKQPEWKQPHITTKGGPNGRAILNLDSDLKLISEEHSSSLAILGGSKFKDYFKSLQDKPEAFVTWNIERRAPKGLLRK
jgi:hypothetical protein